MGSVHFIHDKIHYRESAAASECYRHDFWEQPQRLDRPLWPLHRHLPGPRPVIGWRQNQVSRESGESHVRRFFKNMEERLRTIDAVALGIGNLLHNAISLQTLNRTLGSCKCQVQLPGSAGDREEGIGGQ